MRLGLRLNAGLVAAFNYKSSGVSIFKPSGDSDLVFASTFVTLDCEITTVKLLDNIPRNSGEVAYFLRYHYTPFFSSREFDRKPLMARMFYIRESAPEGH